MPMSIMERIRGTLSGEQTEPDHRYYCKVCGKEFGSSEPTKTEVECHHCGASGSMSLSKL